jgi:putative transposase
VKVVDGTTVSMPDTEESQEAYPQSHTQKKGLGFPIMRLVVVLSLFSAAALGMVCGPCKGKETGECSMFRTMLDTPGILEEGDVLLADRYYASYWLLAMIKARKADAVMRQHQLRTVDFRKGQRLGRDDHKVVLKRPGGRPKWMSREQYERMPEELEVREVRVRVAVKGFRVRTLVVVTTLLDAELYPKEEIAKAFRCRWHVELDLRSIKQTMGMSVLRCKTPQMARKEVWVHLLAYNLVRGVMAEAAKGVEGAAVDPREVSFAGALQTLNAFDMVLRMADPRDLPRLWEILLRAIARHRVGDRPDRYEPRAVKRRAKPIAHLTVPRQQARRRLEREGPTPLAQRSQQQPVAN